MATPKQVRTRGRLSLLLGAVLATVLLVGVAYADNLQNDAGTTTGVTTITAGDSTVITYRLIQNSAPSGDVNGCNADSAHPVTVTITKPAAVSGPASLSFTACGNAGAKTATFSSSTAGTYSIAHSISGGVSGSLFQNQANFTLTVNPVTPTNTAPTLNLPADITAQATSASGATVTYSASANDAEDGPLPPTCSPASGTTFSLGITQVNCSVTDSDGETTSGMFNVNVVDTIAPSIAASVSPAANGNGWNNSPVTVSFACADSGSGIASCTAPILLNLEGANQSATGTAVDNVGNSASAAAGGINIDLTDPTITASVSPSPNGNGWNDSNVTVHFTCTDGLSGIDSCPADVPVSDEGETTVARTATDNAGNTKSTSVTVRIDKTPPTVTATPNPGPNGNGWNNSNVTVSFDGTDSVSDIDSCDADVLVDSEGTHSVSGSCTDLAGNVGTSASVTVKLDKTDPSVSLVGGPSDGATYYFGFVPAAPTCNASDALSGLDGSCSVSGYGTGVGSHTVSASATDKAGNSQTVSRTYTVNAWTLRGFYQPVDMGASVINTVKNGSTVPLKFEIFAGSNELTDTADVASLKQLQVSCSSFSGDPEDAIETTATGGTSLRYDTTAGQFVYNWKTPAQPTKCYVVTMTTDDGSSLSAQFKLK